jgi:hypothetical protein
MRSLWPHPRKPQCAQASRPRCCGQGIRLLVNACGLPDRPTLLRVLESPASPAYSGGEHARFGRAAQLQAVKPSDTVLAEGDANG